jgi:hypothetical protein
MFSAFFQGLICIFRAANGRFWERIKLTCFLQFPENSGIIKSKQNREAGGENRRVGELAGRNAGQAERKVGPSTREPDLDNANVGMQTSKTAREVTRIQVASLFCCPKTRRPWKCESMEKKKRLRAGPCWRTFGSGRSTWAT